MLARGFFVHWSDMMLVLSRKARQQIAIGGGVENGGITVVVLGFDGGKVRLGIAADDSVSIHRGEVQVAINRAALDRGNDA